jgi:hypothetical protein
MLKANEKKAIEKWETVIVVISRRDREQWISDGKTLYKLSEGDDLDIKPQETHDVDPRRFESIMGAIDPLDEVEATGFTFDAKLKSAKRNVSLMLHTHNGTKSVFLVDTDLLKKVKPKKGERFVVGVKNDKRILYNSTRTVGVVAVNDSFMSKLIENYKEMFMALNLMVQMNGEMLNGKS